VAFVDRPISVVAALHDVAQGMQAHRALQIGDLINRRFRVTGFLGEGGMGEVYAAEDTELGGAVAIKALHPRLAESSKFASRFRREIQIARQVTHPNVCRVFDAGRHGETLFLSMELLEGETLAQRIARTGAIPLAQALPIVCQLCEGLAAVHSLGIVHHDFKPGNVIVVRLADGSERAIITDFGLARDTIPKLGPAYASAQLDAGTPSYMSPEQIEGETIDARSDIFAFGLVLYEIVSGRRAFEGTNAHSTMTAILHAEPPPLDSHPALQHIVSRCLAKQPGERFQTVGQVRAAFEKVSPGSSRPQRSIAVLPFVNLSGDKENEYFGDGLAEDIIAALGRIPDLKVIARTSGFAFKGKNEDIRKIAQVLGVTNILEGSVRRAGSRVRIGAQLVSAVDGSHLWSERYDRELADIFAVQDEIAQAIGDALKTELQRLPGNAAATRQRTNPEAYQAYLEGRYWMLQYTSAGMAPALECFERSIRLDPNYAAPHAALGERAHILALYMGVPSRDVIPAGLAAANRALELNPEAGEAYFSRGALRALYEWDWNAAGADLARAIELNPVLVGPRIIHPVYLVAKHRNEEAMAQIRAALELDPLSMTARTVELWVLCAAGSAPLAMERARALTSLFGGSWFSWYHAAITFNTNGLHQESEAALRTGLELSPRNFSLMSCLALVLGRQGRAADAVRLQMELEDLAKQQYVPIYQRALASLGCGDADQFYRLMERSLDEREVGAPIQLITMRPTLRTDPRYQALMKRINLV
jgi:serine/threonine-protein kinase